MAAPTIPRPVRIPTKLYVALSGFMIFISIVSTLQTFPYGDGPDWPALTSSRDPRSGLHILNQRRLEVPAAFYKLLKGCTSILWCVLIPLQHNQALRQRFPAWHRRGGYLATGLSVELGLAGYWMVVRGWTTTHENFFHIHRMYGLSLPGFAWPTFDAALVPLGIFFYSSMVMTIATARRKQFEAHRRWAMIHSSWGYAIAVERALMLALYAAGWLLHALPPAIKHDLLRVPTDYDGKLQAELGALAWSLWIAGIIVTVWIYRQGSGAGIISAWRNSRSVASAKAA
jgi:hypothetical protein